jgi:hypothetical protein
MPYSKAQLIAYTVPTLHNGPPGPLPNPIHAKIATLTDPDEKARVQRFFNVVTWAKTLANFSATDTLKIFMAPEFYFRPPGDNNAYTFNRMINIMECLKQLFTEPSWAHWLIVPGTIFSALPGNAKNAAEELELQGQDGKKHKLKLDKAYMNTCLLVKGGSTSGPSHFFHKRRVSTIDGAPTEQAAQHNPHFHGLLEDFAELKQRLITIDGIRFGVDVCLDHLMRQSKETMLLFPSKNLPAPPPLDIQLITSCGIQPDPQAIATKTGGHLMLCDGIPNSPPWFRTAVKKTTGNGLPADATKRNIDSAATLGDGASKALEKEVPEANRVPKGSGAWFTDLVTVYNPVSI